MTTSSHKLRSLLRLLWQNPLFGDSFPASLDENKLFRLFDDVYARLVELLPPVLQQGMPEASPEEVRQIFDEIAPKSVAFCAATSAGDVEDVQGLANAAAIISLVYWCDQSMDRGDENMLAAVRILNGHSDSQKLPLPLVTYRLEALQHIRYFARQINPNPQDYPYVLNAVENEVLLNQTVLRLLSNLFLENSTGSFWKDYAFRSAQVMIDCSGLMSAGSIVYALYRTHQTELPSLQEIDAHPVLQQFIRKSCNPAVRIFDDAGDAITDSGANGYWGIFNLNIINQNDLLLVRNFLLLSGISDQDADGHYSHAMSLFFSPSRRTPC
ncbi:MAG: hypothetical protein NZP74_09290 [Anaerolineales bacterium]|nr:hypothetical protein [Anaerolineales bacterium]MDW8278367.1 hypothetical protein [Anaerolineales bacterium]